MSGIPVFTTSAINAAKASAQTPQTTSLPTSTANQAPTTTTSTVNASYPSAQPGAPAVSAPTNAATQRYAPVQPTPTTKLNSDAPPAPQPGAAPTPLNKSTIPPPPKAGESYQPPAQVTNAPPSYIPPQMSFSPPTNAYRAQPPSSMTNSTTIPSASYPVSIPTAEFGEPRRSIEHPPGYHQNTYASEPSSDQRRAQDSVNSTVFQDSSEGGIGGLGTENMWSSAKKWASQAGEKLSEAEAEVWKKINKQ
jgi:hypothetical protein